MEIIIEKNPAAASKSAAKIVAETIRSNPKAVLGLASGESPKKLYEILIAMENRGEIDFSKVTFFTLDEYVGLGESNAASYRYYFETHFFGKLKKRPEKIFTPDGLTKNIEAFCIWYENQIQACGGIDLQILGLGQDGHLAFNEPGSSLASRTRIKTLTPETLRANKKSLASLKTTPKHVLTMGLASIMNTKKCLLLAFSPKKAKAVQGMVEGPITASLPASILQMHEKTHVFLDLAAAKLLKRKKYYQFVYSNKPDWQR
jgi:glucosamine-6-phosphate deaminase